MKYQEMIRQILEAVGGKDNVVNAFHCVSRLRLTLKDVTKLDKDSLNGVKGVIKVNQFSDQVQIIIGSHVGEVYQEFIQITGMEENTMVEESEREPVRMSIWGRLTEAVSKIMMPLTTAMVGFGLLKGFCMLFEYLHILDKGGTTYTFFYNLGDSVIYFIPIIVAYSAGKYLKTNIMLSIMMAAALFNPKLTALLATEGGAKLFGILPLGNVSYASTVVPVILMVVFQYWVEKGLKRIMPKLLERAFVPLLTVIVTMTGMYTVIGPVGAALGNGLTWVYTTLYNLCPPLAGALIGGLWSLLVSWGMHTALVPIVMNNLAVMNYDTLMAFASCGNFGQIGGLYGTFFKTKNKETKENALSIIIANLTSGFGLTEPIIYGNNLGLKTPFYCGLIGGACGGLVCSLLGVKVLSVGAFTLYKFALYAGSIVGILVSILVAFAVGFVLTYMKGVDRKEA